jgi:hypothetical protein
MSQAAILDAVTFGNRIPPEGGTSERSFPLSASGEGVTGVTAPLTSIRLPEAESINPFTPYDGLTFIAGLFRAFSAEGLCLRSPGHGVITQQAAPQLVE